ncbi:MAG: helix-turn-helix domain-containing protein [Candidatus Acidiferrales bacterium]
MKPRTAQLDARKNPDSPRVHGLRLTVSSFPVASGKNQGRIDEAISSPSHEIQASELPLAESQNGTTGARGHEQSQLLTVREVADLLHVPVSWVYERTRRRGSEQLPHVKLGKYLRFEESTVTEFIRRQRCA